MSMFGIEGVFSKGLFLMINEVIFCYFIKLFFRNGGYELSFFFFILDE